MTEGSASHSKVLENRERVHRSLEALRGDLEAEFGRGPGRVWFLPLTAAAIGLVAAFALRRSLARSARSGDTES